MKQLSLIFLFVSAFFSRLNANSDTLTYNEFILLLLKNHPVAAIADLKLMAGKAEFNKAKGAFEPVIGASYDRKFFEGKNYFSLFNSEVKIPTWIGEVKAGYDYYYGARLNPENYLPQNGMSYLSLSIPLVQNLFTDKKRTQLKQAKVFRESTNFERTAMMNELIADATAAYWLWSASYQKYLLNSTAMDLARQRHQMIIQSALLGDRPMIDTTESVTQLQYREVAKQQAYTDWLQATFNLSNFCWNASQSPVMIDTSVVAELPNSQISNWKIVLDEQLSGLSSQPDLNIYRLKIKSLDYERKLKMELLKPQLNANYYLLGNGTNFSPSATSNVFTERYKFGVNFQLPLLFAQSRNEYKLAKYKLQEATLAYELKQQTVANKIKSYWYDFENYRSQLSTVAKITTNNKLLLEAEQERFFNGESNVFLINSRENKYIESQEKLYELYVKVYKSKAALLQHTGTLLTQTMEMLK